MTRFSRTFWTSEVMTCAVDVSDLAMTGDFSIVVAVVVSVAKAVRPMRANNVAVRGRMYFCIGCHSDPTYRN